MRIRQMMVLLIIHQALQTLPVRLQQPPLEVSLITSSTPATSTTTMLAIEAAAAATGRLLRMATKAPTACI